MRRSAPSRVTEPLSFTMQEEERGRGHFTSLRTEAVMSGRWAAILVPDRWGSKVILEVKNLHSPQGRGGGGFITTSPNVTATEGAEKRGLACRPFSLLVGGAPAWV